MFRRRIPIEIAPPGTDPTEEYHPLPKRGKGDLKSTLPWIIGLVLFCLAGYNTFIKPDDGQAKAPKNQLALFKGNKNAVPQAPTPTADQPMALRLPGEEIKATVAPTPAPSPTPMPVPTSSPTPTVEPPAPEPLLTNILAFGVFENGEQITCACNLDTGDIDGENPELCRAYPPSMCKKE